MYVIKHIVRGCMLRHGHYVGGQVQKNILLMLLWAPAVVGEPRCSIIPWRLVATMNTNLLHMLFSTSEAEKWTN